MMDTLAHGVTSSSSISPQHYTVVDVKFEAGDGSTSQELINNIVESDQGDNGSDSSDNVNKRKRKVPQKKLSVEEEDDPPDMSSVVKVEYGAGDYDDIAVDDNIEVTDNNDEELTVWRANNQQINSKQREDCPVCGDKANGLHYGIFSCEG